MLELQLFITVFVFTFICKLIGGILAPKDDFIVKLIIGVTFLSSVTAFYFTQGATVTLPFLLFVVYLLYIKRRQFEFKLQFEWDYLLSFIAVYISFALSKNNFDFDFTKYAHNGIDEPFYTQLIASIKSQGSEDLFSFFSTLDLDIQYSNKFYHFVDLWVLNLLSTISPLSLDIDNYWLVYISYLDAIIVYSIAYFLKDWVRKLYILLPLSLFTYLFIPVLPIASIGNNGVGFNSVFTPKFFMTGFILKVYFDLFKKDFWTPISTLLLIIALMLNPLYVLWVGILEAIYFVFYWLNRPIDYFKKRVEVVLIFFVFGILFVGLIMLSKTNSVSIPFDITKALNYATRVYGVKAIYFILWWIPLIFLRNEISRNWKLVSSLVGLYLAVNVLCGVFYTNREHWQIVAIVIPQLLTFSVVSIAIVVLTSRSLGIMKKAGIIVFYTVLFIHEVFVVSQVSHHFKVKALPLKSELLDIELSNQTVGYFNSTNKADNEYKLNSLFPFYGGILSAYGNEITPICLDTNLSIRLNTKTELGVYLSSPVYNSCILNEQSVNDFITQHKINHVFINSIEKNEIDDVIELLEYDESRLKLLQNKREQYTLIQLKSSK